MDVKRADKATFKSLDGHQIEIKISSYLNGLYPILRINSIDGEKTNSIIPLKVYLKDSSIDALILTAQGVIENMKLDIDKEDPLTDKEKEKLFSITHKQINDIASSIVDKLPEIILKEFIKKFTKDATKDINEHLILNNASSGIREMKMDGRLTREIIQGLYNQNPNLETIINNGKRINVMDYIDETLEDKIKKVKKECENSTDKPKYIKQSQEEQIK